MFLILVQNLTKSELACETDESSIGAWKKELTTELCRQASMCAGMVWEFHSNRYPLLLS